MGIMTRDDSTLIDMMSRRAETLELDSAEIFIMTKIKKKERWDEFNAIKSMGEVTKRTN